MSLQNWFSQFPRLGRFFGDLDNLVQAGRGLSVSSDNKHVYIEAHVPGLTKKDVELSLDEDRVLWIRGSKVIKEENKEKKFYRRSQSEFSYALPLGDEVDVSVEPEATVKDGVLKITFAKKKEKQKKSKKINIKE